jgi:hypothetical protein
MDGWTPAAKVKGLFPEPATATQAAAPSSPPPLPNEREQAASMPSERDANLQPQRHDLPTRLKTWFLSLASNTKAAGRLVALQAERTKLANVTLPAVYRELGRHVHSGGQFREELSEQHQAIDDLARKLQEIGASRASTENMQGAGGKAKALAGSAKAAANRKLLEQKRGQAFVMLGKAAYDVHGQKAGPEELVGKVAEHRSRLDSLDAEIAELSYAGSKQVFTPKRIIAAGIGVPLLALGVFVLFLRGSDSVLPLMPSGGESYTERAFDAFSEGRTYKRLQGDGEPSESLKRDVREALRDVSPRSRQDFLQALWILDDGRFVGSGTDNFSLDRHADYDLDTFIAVFDKPDDGYKIDAEGWFPADQGHWTYKLSDGDLHLRVSRSVRAVLIRGIRE